MQEQALLDQEIYQQRGAGTALPESTNASMFGVRSAVATINAGRAMSNLLDEEAVRLRDVLQVREDDELGTEAAIAALERTDKGAARRLRIAIDIRNQGLRFNF